MVRSWAVVVLALSGAAVGAQPAAASMVTPASTAAARIPLRTVTLRQNTVPSPLAAGPLCWPRSPPGPPHIARAPLPWTGLPAPRSPWPIPLHLAPPSLVAPWSPLGPVGAGALWLAGESGAALLSLFLG